MIVYFSITLHVILNESHIIERWYYHPAADSLVLRPAAADQPVTSMSTLHLTLYRETRDIRQLRSRQRQCVLAASSVALAPSRGQATLYLVGHTPLRSFTAHSPPGKRNKNILPESLLKKKTQHRDKMSSLPVRKLYQKMGEQIDAQIDAVVHIENSVYLRSKSITNDQLSLKHFLDYAISLLGKFL